MTDHLPQITIEHVFDIGWESVDGLTPPVFDGGPPDWDQPDHTEKIDALACADPGSGPDLDALLTVSASDVLAEIDPRRLGEDARLALCVAAHRREAQLAGVKARAVAVFAGPFPADEHSAAAFAWCEISAALKLSEGHARSYTDEARHLFATLPATLQAAIDQGLAWAKVRTVVTATMGLTPEQCAAVEARVLPKAADRSPAAHRDMVDRWVRKTAPDVWKNRREQKLRDTALIRLHHGDGVADVIAVNIDSAQAGRRALDRRRHVGAARKATGQHPHPRPVTRRRARAVRPGLSRRCSHRP